MAPRCRNACARGIDPELRSTRPAPAITGRRPHPQEVSEQLQIIAAAVLEMEQALSGGALEGLNDRPRSGRPEAPRPRARIRM